MRYLVCLCIAGLVAGLGGCQDLTSSTGAKGRLIYSLFTEYDVPERELTEARLVTGHEQRLLVSLTPRGRQEVEMPGQIQHTVLPAQGVFLTNEGGGEDTPPGMRILVSTPGIYTIQSRIGSELVDRIDLTFEEPAGFELLTHVRAPWEQDFQRASGDPIAVEEGAQVTFQAVPLDGAGQRLAGDMTTDMAVDPIWTVVPGQGVIEAYENGVWTVGGAVNFYFIEPGLVTFTVIDPVSGATGEQVFDVAPVTRS
jgi:hypothetical protein